MRVLDLLTELEEVVERGNTLPFSSKALINAEEILEIIDEIKDSLPFELSESKKIVEERKKIIFSAKSEAEHIKADALKRKKDMIERAEISKLATANAGIILKNANNSAKTMKTETQSYVDRVLYTLQMQIKEINEKIEENRRNLREMK